MSEDNTVELRTLIDTYNDISKMEKEYKVKKESVRKGISELIARSGLGPGNKVIATKASMTISQADNVVAVDFNAIEKLLGDVHVDYITKKLDYKKLKESIDEGTIDATALKYVMIEKGEPIFTIRGIKRNDISSEDDFQK